jgi:inorganic pyrophosphatase
MVVIETRKGSPNYGTFVLKGVLPAGPVFPFDFGFVPLCAASTAISDVLVPMDAPVFSACIVSSRHNRIVSREGPRSKPERHCRVARDVEARLFG